MRIIRTTAPWILLISVNCSTAWGQGPPLSVEAFAEGGASLIRNASLSGACPLVCTPSGCPPCPGPFPFSNAGRLFTGARLRTGREAIEVSYSYSPNPIQQYYNRLTIFSLNYIHYLSMRSKVQPFATIGLGAERFSGPYTSANGFRPVWNFGGGTDIVLQRHLALRLELRDYVGGQPSGFVGTSHDIVPSAGIVFRFR
jgi:hypothetical protein